MKTVAVICEYNPFHGGHAYLFEKIREKFGGDTAILCIMSGNFTQRGEAAIIPKTARAAAAVDGGADLVLELPFPYSCSSAERFARAGVHIATSLGCVDTLAFGAECGDADILTALAKRLESPDFQNAYFAADASLGSAEKTEAVYRALFGNDEGLAVLRRPNNLLGVEYIRAILRENAEITPFAIERMGADHDAVLSEKEDEFPSGKSIREALLCGDDSPLSRLPAYSAEQIKSTISARKSLADNELLMNYLLMHYRLSPKENLEEADGMKGGLAGRVLRAAREASDGADFFARLRTKKYTDAFLRRALLTGVFSLTRENLNTPPSYTQLLAMSEKGQALLRRIRKSVAISVLTKPGDADKLPPPAYEQSFLSMRADSLYAALFRVPLSPSDTVRYAPYRKFSQNKSQS